MAVAAAVRRQGVVEAVDEEVAVRQAGQRIVQGHVPVLVGLAAQLRRGPGRDRHEGQPEHAESDAEDGPDAPHAEVGVADHGVVGHHDLGGGDDLVGVGRLDGEGQPHGGRRAVVLHELRHPLAGEDPLEVGGDLGAGADQGLVAGVDHDAVAVHEAGIEHPSAVGEPELRHEVAEEGVLGGIHPLLEVLGREELAREHAHDRVGRGRVGGQHPLLDDVADRGGEHDPEQQDRQQARQTEASHETVSPHPP